MIAGGTVGVIALALIAYFLTRPSGNSNASGPTANATISQTSMNPPAPSTAGGGPVQSANASASASASATASPSASAGKASPSSTVAVNVAQVRVSVFNGSGVNQRAASIKTALVNQGFALATVGGTDPKTPTTKVYYPSTRADSAAAVANALKIPSTDLSESANYAEVTVVIGTDWSTGNTYPAG